jgi:hypothetical protein
MQRDKEFRAARRGRKGRKAETQKDKGVGTKCFC